MSTALASFCCRFAVLIIWDNLWLQHSIVVFLWTNCFSKEASFCSSCLFLFKFSFDCSPFFVSRFHLFFNLCFPPSLLFALAQIIRLIVTLTHRAAFLAVLAQLLRTLVVHKPVQASDYGVQYNKLHHHWSHAGVVPNPRNLPSEGCCKCNYV